MKGEGRELMKETLGGGMGTRTHGLSSKYTSFHQSGCPDPRPIPPGLY